MGFLALLAVIVGCVPAGKAAAPGGVRWAGRAAVGAWLVPVLPALLPDGWVGARPLTIACMFALPAVVALGGGVLLRRALGKPQQFRVLPAVCLLLSSLPTPLMLLERSHEWPSLDDFLRLVALLLSPGLLLSAALPGKPLRAAVLTGAALAFLAAVDKLLGGAGEFDWFRIY